LFLVFLSIVSVVPQNQIPRFPIPWKTIQQSFVKLQLLHKNWVDKLTGFIIGAMVDFGEWSLENWSVGTIVGLCGAILVGLEILQRILHPIFSNTGTKLIPIKGKHLDTLSFDDNLFISINKGLTCMFVYHLIWVCQKSPSIVWNHSEVNLYNTLGSIVAFYIFYDFFYTNFHRFLHIRSLYAYIHKHHHKQKAPSRGNLDAINVHPFEFVVGEYLHLLTIYFIPSHIYTVVFFILAGGVLASLNHTRYDINIPWVYCVKVHDVHHRLPESNYGQYIMFWDSIFGSYRSYDQNTSFEPEDKQAKTEGKKIK
jgi:sterol desaturase/sphingolipid hydroxylase (fatty acid hydroxylase superfamily)